MGLLGDFLPDFLPADPDQRAAARIGLLSLGATMLANSNRGFGTSAGLGLLGGVQGYQEALQDQQRRALQAQQVKALGLETQIKQMAFDKQKQVEEAYRRFYGQPGTPPIAASATPSIGTTAPTTAIDNNPAFPRVPLPSWMPQPSAPAPMASQAAATAPTAGDNYSRHLAFAQYLEKNGLAGEAQKYYDLAEKFRPKFATEFRQAMGPDGKLRNYQVADDGTIREVSLGVKPDMVEMDLGGVKQWVDKNALNGGQQFKKTLTPGEAASNSLGWTRLNFDKQNADRPQHVIVDGQPMTFSPKTGQYAPGVGPGGAPLPKVEKPLTEAQAKANLFGTRAQESDKILTSLAQIGDSGPFGLVKNDQPGLIKRGVEGTLGIIPDWAGGEKLSSAGGAIINWLPSVTGGPNAYQQQAEQAQRDFINAVLRRESGAVISPSEFDNARKQYFPQPGDEPAVIAQKARNRQIAIQGMLAEVPGGSRGIQPAATSAGGSKGDKVVDFGSLK